MFLIKIEKTSKVTYVQVIKNYTLIYFLTIVLAINTYFF